MENSVPRRPEFASDNYAGVCPEAMQALEDANQGFAVSYGDDAYTARACDMLRDLFETNCEVFFVFNGTAANSLALATLCNSYHSILCADTAHVETDECGAPEFFSNGTKILTIPQTNGKINLDEADTVINKRTDIHFPKPKGLSITQSTELGTVYSPDDLHAISSFAGKHNLKVHMDGARFANAVASLGLAPKEITWKAGVDVLCFGGTKMGMPISEAVVFFNTRMAEEFAYRCKQAGQLASKMRFLASPWIGLLENGTWLKYAKHANESAAYLAQQLSGIDGISTIFPVEANAVFLDIPARASEKLRDKGWYFYDFIGINSARLMCSWATRREDIDEFVADLKAAVG